MNKFFALVLFFAFAPLAHADQQTPSGDRVIENPASGGGIALRVNTGSGKIDVLKALSTGSLVFGGAATGSVTSTFQSGGVTTLQVKSTATNQNSILEILGNYTGPTAQSWRLGLNQTLATGSLEFYNTTGTSLAGSVTTGNTWNFGPSTSTEAMRIAGGNGTRVILSGNNNQALTGTHYNWEVGVQDHLGDSLEITPSAAAGGSTFTTPALTVTQNGAVALGKTGVANAITSHGHIYYDVYDLSQANPAANTWYSVFVTSSNHAYTVQAGARVTGGYYEDSRWIVSREGSLNTTIATKLYEAQHNGATSNMGLAVRISPTTGNIECQVTVASVTNLICIVMDDVPTQ